MEADIFKKASAWTVKIGLFIVPFVSLLVSSSMLFPFITGKNFTFRIIVEIIFALWAGLAFFAPEYRPRRSALFKAVSVFMLILLAADLFGPNPYRSFFSNYERMEGFMMLAHLYLYFVMLSSVFKTRRDWMIFFHAVIAAGVLVSLVGWLQHYCADSSNASFCSALAERLSKNSILSSIPLISRQGGFRVDSTIGNPTYLAAYLLFQVWLLAILIYEFGKKWWAQALYALILLFELAIIYLTATRGAVLALLIAGTLFALAVVFFWPKVFPKAPQGRKFAAGLLILLVLIPAALWRARSSEFVRSSPALFRLTNYSFKERTILSRFMIWGISVKGFLERPVLGWGQENFYLVFQKYYNPALWSQEPWFDRSHNVFFDWLIHAGMLGLLGYLAIFGAVFWSIVSALRKNLIQAWVGLALMGLFLAYFLQNLFVFDNLNTYMLFFAFLAYSEYLSVPAPRFSKELRFDSGRLVAAGAVSVAALFLILAAGYLLHVKPIREGQALIKAMRVFRGGSSVDDLIGAFESALLYRTFGDGEVKEQLAGMARAVLASPNVSAEVKKKFAQYAIEETRPGAIAPNRDVKHALLFGSLLSQAGELDPAYFQEAERILLDASKLAPSKQAVYFELAQFYLSAGKLDQAVEVLQKAWELDKNFAVAGAHLWFAGILAQRPDLISQVRTATRYIDLDEGSLFRIAFAYQTTKDYGSALEVYKELVRVAPQNSKYRATYAALLANAGRRDEARLEAQEAVKLDPSLKGETEQFLKILK